MRSPFQVLVVPFRRIGDGLQFLVLQRSDNGHWQFVAGGGEGEEEPTQSAQRELAEELAIDVPVRALATVSPVPVTAITGEFSWGPEHLIVMEHAFCVQVGSEQFMLSDEHSAARWMNYNEACSVLEFDSNRTAAWEIGAMVELGTLE